MSSEAASGRRAQGSERLWPMSKNSVTIRPCPEATASARNRCHARDVTGSWWSSVDTRP
ncbi:hypothetical protein [Yinghuangia sp. YIM S09857]|uniref:hypothetical protein n=1 Tax=Yinghuangia sp. YIM S09857 TaxID=3436929 RepID=UPI003F5319C1